MDTAVLLKNTYAQIPIAYSFIGTITVITIIITWLVRKFKKHKGKPPTN